MEFEQEITQLKFDLLNLRQPVLQTNKRLNVQPPGTSNFILNQLTKYNTLSPGRNDGKYIIKLQQALFQADKSLKKLKNEYHEYRKQKATEEELLKGEFHAMRKEISKLISMRCQSKIIQKSQLKHIKTQEIHITDLKKQMKKLQKEKRRKINADLKVEFNLVSEDAAKSKSVPDNFQNKFKKMQKMQRTIKTPQLENLGICSEYDRIKSEIHISFLF